MRRHVLGLTVLVALAGCSSYEGPESLPLPGAVSGKDTYTVTVMLPDATNLVAKETCRTNDTVVGSVESIELDDELRAVVVCRIKDSVQLPENVAATLRETSLLGERFVSLDVPVGQKPHGRLAPGTTLPMATTRVDPNVEMVLGALSQVLNGGSLGSIETITRELNIALSQSDLGGSIDRLGTVVGKLNTHRTDLTESLVQLDRLAGRLAQQRKVIGSALDAVPGGLAVLDRQRPRLVSALREVSHLSSVAVPLIRRSQAATVADLRHLAPVLTRLTEAGDEIALTLERVIAFPFPSNAESSIKGDYGGFYGQIHLDIDALNALLGVKPGAGPGAPTQPAATPSAEPLLPFLPALPEIAGLPVIAGLEDVFGGLSDLLGGKP